MWRLSRGGSLPGRDLISLGDSRTPFQVSKNQLAQDAAEGQHRKHEKEKRGEVDFFSRAEAVRNYAREPVGDPERANPADDKQHVGAPVREQRRISRRNNKASNIKADDKAGGDHIRLGFSTKPDRRLVWAHENDHPD